jgi:hypothetical protein
MARQKKIKSLQIEEVKKEVVMNTDIEPSTLEKEDNAGLEITLESIQQEIDKARQELEQTKIKLEEKRHELKTLPRREIDETEQKIIDKQVNNINKKKNKNDVIEKQRIFDSQLVTGRFMNRRSPGQKVKLPYLKYSTDPVKWYELRDGGTYTLPRGFADQLNGGDDKNPCYYTPKFVQKEGPQNLTETLGENSMIAEVDTSNKKYAFVPIGFAA